jgi:PAS domain S-box-containing protein|nr:ATP-binding protein [Candidatus Krumholzibacteria bacterium]
MASRQSWLPGLRLQRGSAGRAPQFQQKLQEFVDNLPDPTFIIDTRKRVLAWNGALAALTGVSSSEILGKGQGDHAVPFPGEAVPVLADHFGDVDDEHWRQHYDRVETRGDTVYAEGFFPFLHGGRGAHLSVTASPFRRRDGQIIGAIQTMRDLTGPRDREGSLRQREDDRRIRDLNEMLEQRVIEGTHELLAMNKALRLSEERFRRIIESLQEGYIFYSRTTDGQFTYVSPSYRKILGLSDLGDFSSRFAAWLQRGDNRPAREAAEKINLGYRQDPEDFHIQCRDGKLRTMEIQETPVFRKNGAISSVEGLLRDVTQDRHNQALMEQTQQQLIQSEKQAALGSMVAGLSHEINTPLGIGVTAASHLVEEIKQCLQAYSARQLTQGQFENYLSEAGESAQLIQANLNRATDLLQNFKQVATDQTAAKERSFKLDEYLGDVVQSLKPRFKNTGFRIVCRCPEDLVLHCDPGALYQVLSNLVMNSLTHGFEGLLVGEISIRAHRRGPFLELDYRDNGNGMKPHELRRLYEPFFTTKRGRGGTGLGMHIVYNNVTKTLGGNIKSTSKPGRGTRITITLPLTGEADHV